MIIYVVGQVIPSTPWIIMGIFDNVERAEAACVDSTYFIGPLELNYDIGPGIQEWPGIYFPKADSQHNEPKA